MEPKAQARFVPRVPRAPRQPVLKHDWKAQSRWDEIAVAIARMAPYLSQPVRHSGQSGGLVRGGYFNELWPS